MLPEYSRTSLHQRNPQHQMFLEEHAFTRAAGSANLPLAHPGRYSPQ
jgi:hypothetical protein